MMLFLLARKKNIKLFAMSENWGLQSTLENNGFYSVMKKRQYMINQL